MGAFGKAEGIKVTAEKAEERTIIEVVNASGKIYPEIEVKISPDISGNITSLEVAEGDTVKKGQLLARIYADVYNIQKNQAASGVSQSQAQVAQTQAQVANAKASLVALSADAALNAAKANYNAAQQGIKGTEATVRSAQAGVNSAQSNLAKANTDLGRTALTAPMDGVISLLSVKVGESVSGNSFNVGTEMMRIADMNSMEIRVDVGENDIPKVKLGDSALISIDAYADRKFKGIVTQIASSNNGAASSGLGAASTDVTQYKVYIRLLKDSYADLLGKGSFPFRPGMSANADIQTRRVTKALSVPINAVTTREKTDSTKNSTTKTANADELNTSIDDLDIVVFVRKADNTVYPVIVKTGIQDINYLQITSGLKPGEEVVTGPYDVVTKTLKKGTEVKVVDKKELFNTKK